MRIPDDSRIVNRRVREILLPTQSMIILIIGEDSQPRLPALETSIHAGDVVLAVTLHESEGALRDALMAPAEQRSF